MTAATAPLCGHWWRSGACPWLAGRRRVAHRCTEPADHHDDEPATSCRCRCGATTERPSR